MSNTIRDKRLKAYVLRRTNYGEADRILNLITEEGKVSAIAKSVRKEKSKLAGSIEMFSLIDINLHFGRRDLATVTGAKMLKFYKNLLTDLTRMELASFILKKINVAAEISDSPVFFKITDESLRQLDAGISPALVESWFLFNLAHASGEQINMYRDVSGTRLDSSLRYYWDQNESALSQHPSGDVDANVIKVIRLILSAKIDVVSRVKDIDEYLPQILHIARAINKM